MDIFMINYADLESNEKKQMFYDFSINTQESCKEFSDIDKISIRKIILIMIMAFRDKTIHNKSRNLLISNSCFYYINFLDYATSNLVTFF